MFNKRVIGDRYLTRWHLVPRNRFFNIYLHRFVGDDDPVLHDHPWWSMSFLLKGMLVEKSHAPTWSRDFFQWKRILWLLPVVRRPAFAHSLEVWGSPVWTLFLTGPVVRPWGFLCSSGWKLWSDVTGPNNERLGGCDD
jgi:hypothetical protein